MAATDFIEPAIWFSFSCSILFVLGYTKIAPWWRNAVGRAMVSLDVALMILLTPSVAHYSFGWTVGDTFFLWYYVGSLILAGLITLRRLAVVWRIQNQVKHDLKENRDRTRSE